MFVNFETCLALLRQAVVHGALFLMVARTVFLHMLRVLNAASIAFPIIPFSGARPCGARAVASIFRTWYLMLTCAASSTALLLVMFTVSAHAEVDGLCC